MSRTFAIIKPDAVAKKAAGPILARIEEEGFKIVGMRLVHMSSRDAEGFYRVHRERPFFGSICPTLSGRDHPQRQLSTSSRRVNTKLCVVACLRLKVLLSDVQCRHPAPERMLEYEERSH